MEQGTVTDDFEPTREPFDLKPMDGWPAQRHQFAEPDIWAVQAALVTGRPLLVRGEPGTGKSQLARAVAQEMGRPLLYEVITHRTEVTDLLWQFDAVGRLGEAQVLGAGGAEPDEAREILAPDKYIRPGKLWWAFDWPAAAAQAEYSKSPQPPSGGHSWKNGCVLLIDEIDKADSELPNALLECFANQSFQVPHLPQPVARAETQPPPLVVVTTNEERELPAPFLRRCLVLQLTLDRDEAKLKRFLKERGAVHFEPKFGHRVDYDNVLDQAADLLIKDRKKAGAGVLHRPGQAEYLDLCLAVFEISAKKQRPVDEVLTEVARFNLQKNPLLP